MKASNIRTIRSLVRALALVTVLTAVSTVPVMISAIAAASAQGTEMCNRGDGKRDPKDCPHKVAKDSAVCKRKNGRHSASECA